MVRSADSADWGICGSMRRSLFFGIRRWRPMLKLRFAGLRKGASEPEGTSISAFRRARSGTGIPMVSGRCTIYGKIYTIYENNQRSEKTKNRLFFCRYVAFFATFGTINPSGERDFVLSLSAGFGGGGCRRFPAGPEVPAGTPDRGCMPKSKIKLHANVRQYILRKSRVSESLSGSGGCANLRRPERCEDNALFPNALCSGIK